MYLSERSFCLFPLRLLFVEVVRSQILNGSCIPSPEVYKSLCLTEVFRWQVPVGKERRKEVVRKEVVANKLSRLWWTWGQQSHSAVELESAKKIYFLWSLIWFSTQNRALRWMMFIISLIHWRKMIFNVFWLHGGSPGLFWESRRGSTVRRGTSWVERVIVNVAMPVGVLCRCLQERQTAVVQFEFIIFTLYCLYILSIYRKRARFSISRIWNLESRI